MASEKITAIIDSVKELSVLELKELIELTAKSSVFPLLLLLLPLLLALQLPLRKRRPSSTSSWLRLRSTKSARSSSWSRRSPVWA